LLLALSWYLSAKEKEIDRLSRSVREQEIIVAGLTERNRTLEEIVGRGDDFDDLFRELELAERQQFAQEQANAALREKVEALERRNKALEERAAAAEMIMRAARKAGVSAEDPEKLLEEIAARLEQLERVKEGMRAAGLGESQVTEFVERTLGEREEAERRAERLEGQLRNLQRLLEGLGRGTEMPACRASPDSGKPEYIFDAALTSRGIVTRDNALPHRSADQAELPLRAMVFEEEVSPEQFRVMSQAVYEWSVREGCRFFVRVYDLTKDDEKITYKRYLRTVGEHFYYFEVLDGTFR